MYQHSLPKRVRVLVIGGGIHGVGVLHDLASRDWQDAHLIEKGTLGEGTSSRSTKLIHGGLRYLRNIRDFGLVSEALRERRLLMQLAPDLVRPMEFLFPILKQGGLPRTVVKSGLMLYDILAGKHKIGGHSLATSAQLKDKAPILDMERFKAVYSYWDAQTDDLALVERVASSACKLGAGITENCTVLGITPDADGYRVTVRDVTGATAEISALYVVNAAGPWANRLLEMSKITPTHRAINNKGVHLLLRDMGLKSGLFLQSGGDNRIFFVLPWQGYTLIGTTEEIFDGNPDQLSVRADEVQYLLERCDRYLTIDLKKEEIFAKFAGLRWLALEPGRNITDTTRSFTIGERSSQRGLLLTIYGGKLTTYRTLSALIGDRISDHFGEFRSSRTADPESWVSPSESAELSATATALSRFLGIA